MKNIIVTLYPYKSAFFPIIARWKEYSVNYSEVFRNTEDARRILTAKYKNVIIRDKTI